LIPVTPAGEENVEEIQQMQVEDEENTEDIQQAIEDVENNLTWRCTEAFLLQNLLT